MGSTHSGAMDSERYESITRAFSDIFDRPAEDLIRAPGRVNLIGEHIDYHGYPVLPMALTQDILIAVAANDLGKIRMHNLDSAKYSLFECSATDFTISKTKPFWYDYILCGIKGIQDQLTDVQSRAGFDLLVEGTIPPNAGLSSSSALVCCSALAAATVYQNPLPPEVLASICAKAERYIGTEGGGMDQAISFLAKKGQAKLIEFDPLRSTDVTLPPDAVFVVANSCVEMNKAATAHFNTRVAEGRVGVMVLAKLKDLPWREVRKAAVLQEKLEMGPVELIQLVIDTFQDCPYSAVEISELLGVSIEEFRKECLTEPTRNLDSFHLRKRLMHIFSEVDRVWSFKEMADTVNEAGSGDEPSKVLQVLGDLMYASHSSCRDDYECSCSDLDELVEVMMKGGALGARLTGAGWGGCAVALVEKGKEEGFLEFLRKNFFELKEDRLKNLPKALFVTCPGDGAQVLSVEQ